MPHKIAFFELEGWEEKSIKEAFSGEDVFLSKEKITELCLPNAHDFEIISIFVDSRIDTSVLDYFSNLKCIATRSTGYDHIDIAAAKARGVRVLSVPNYGNNTVAEFTFGIILNLTRKIYQSIHQIKETGSFSLAGLRGMDLKGKTIGIVGTGRIGKEVIKAARGFGMNVLACDPYPDIKFAEEFHITYATLDDVLGGADIISLHCPLDNGTRHLVNKDNIRKIKRGAYLINTARGPIVETEALVIALEDGTLAGAGLDVLEEEGETKDELTLLARGHPKEEDLKTVLRNHVLMKMPNVFVTPHTAFNSQEAMERILMTTFENIKSVIDGKPINIVQ